MALHPYQQRKLNSFNCVAKVEEYEGKLIITLEPAYSWSKDCFTHTRNFDKISMQDNFNDAVAALRKFKY